MATREGAIGLGVGKGGRMSWRNDAPCANKDSPLTATQLGETLLPDLAETDFHLQALHQVLAFRRLKLRKVPW